MMTVQNSSIGLLDPQRPLGELVAERPGRARLLERLHIDYCCGGQQTLAEACTKAGLQLETVEVALRTLDEVDASFGERELTDWRTADTAQLCEHIVGVHHEFLRRSFPKLESLIGTVVRVHGSQDPALDEVSRVFETIRSALEPHLASEETELFPAILAAAQGGTPVPEEILAGHEYEHAVVGAALVELHALCDGYDRRHARCNTHRAMLDALEELELDIHEHVHEENNILFARARTARPDTGETPAHPDTGEAPRAASRLSAERHDPVLKRRQPLPACCEGWVAGQGERWARSRR